MFDLDEKEEVSAILCSSFLEWNFIFDFFECQQKQYSLIQ